MEDSCSPKGLQSSTFEHKTSRPQRGFGCQLPRDPHLETSELEVIVRMEKAPTRSSENEVQFSSLMVDVN